MSRREQIEQLLAGDPHSPFLQYALALEFVKEGAVERGLEQLARLNQEQPDFVPAWHQRGRIQWEHGEPEQAAETLRAGIEVAHRTGDTHAAGEMQGLLDLM